MNNEQMLKLSYETDMPAGDQIYCYLSCSFKRNERETKQNRWKKRHRYDNEVNHCSGTQGNQEEAVVAKVNMNIICIIIFTV